MRNVIGAFVSVDANERYREVPCIKRIRACHREVGLAGAQFPLAVSAVSGLS